MSVSVSVQKCVCVCTCVCIKGQSVWSTSVCVWRSDERTAGRKQCEADAVQRLIQGLEDPERKTIRFANFCFFLCEHGYGNAFVRTVEELWSLADPNGAWELDHAAFRDMLALGVVVRQKRAALDSVPLPLLLGLAFREYGFGQAGGVRS